MFSFPAWICSLVAAALLAVPWALHEEDLELKEGRAEAHARRAAFLRSDRHRAQADAARRIVAAHRVRRP